MPVFNEELVHALTNIIPKKKDQLLFLIENMYMGKEAAYRRLRGDVHFTFSEACIIAKKLGISLDKLANINSITKPCFELELTPLHQLDYTYYKLCQHEDSFELLISLKQAYIISASNMIPYSFTLPYENLFKMYTFRMMYQMREKETPCKFSEIILSEDINKRRELLAKKVRFLPTTIIILDREVFSHFLNEINYFFVLGLISEEEKKQLVKELGQLIDDFEFCADYGHKKTGEKIWIYICNINFSSNYAYVSGEGFERASMDGIYLMDTLSTPDKHICRLHKDWLESLKRYSTLITLSGEKERRNFFDKQKSLISD